MLLKWRTFLHACDADILTGYNVQVRPPSTTAGEEIDSRVSRAELIIICGPHSNFHRILIDPAEF